jgi:hypothetical protein
MAETGGGPPVDGYGSMGAELAVRRSLHQQHFEFPAGRDRPTFEMGGAASALKGHRVRLGIAATLYCYNRLSRESGT